MVYWYIFRAKSVSKWHTWHTVTWHTWHTRHLILVYFWYIFKIIPMEYTKIWYILVWLGDWHESFYYIIDDEKD